MEHINHICYFSSGEGGILAYISRGTLSLLMESKNFAITNSWEVSSKRSLLNLF
jgi:hypothetical protein